MFGCHNCNRKPQKDELYEETACASCPAAYDPEILSYVRFDPERIPDPCCLYPAMPDECLLEDACEEDPSCRDALISALAQTVKMLLRLKEKKPSTYRVVEARMDEPHLTYTGLAEKLACRKQNIDYHLRRALEFCPELEFALFSRKQRLRRRR